MTDTVYIVLIHYYYDSTSILAVKKTEEEAET